MVESGRTGAAVGYEFEDQRGPVAVTAIVSTYCAAEFLSGCLDDLIRQTLGARLEILVIDSGSPQDESKIVREYLDANAHPGLRLVRTSQRETTAMAFNRAIRLARGRYLTTANTDDRHRADALQVLARALDQHQEYGLVYADSLITEQPNETFEHNSASRRYAWPDYTPAAALSCCLFGAQPMWRREVHDTVGGFSKAHAIADDQDMFFRIAWKFGAVHLRETLGLFLQRPDSNSGLDHRAATLRDVLDVLRHYRTTLPIADVFPTIDAGSPQDRASAWFEFGNLAALGPYNDFRFALQCYGRAFEERNDCDDSLAAAFANNVGCLLACIGADTQRVAAALARGGALGAANRSRIDNSMKTGQRPRASDLKFADWTTESIRANRLSRGLELQPDGSVGLGPARERSPWRVFDHRDGIVQDVSSPRTPALVLPAPRQSEVDTPSVLIVMYGWNDSGGGTMLPRQVAAEFAMIGIDTTVFYAASRSDPKLGRYALREHEEDGVRLFAVTNRPTEFMDADHPEREARDPSVEALFDSVLDRVRPDLVHVWNLHNLGMSLAGLAKSRGLPVVLSSNNYWPICPRLYLIDEHLRRCDGAAGDDGAKCVSCVGGTKRGHAERTRAARVLLDDHIDIHLAVSHRARQLFVDNGADPDRIRVLQQQPASVATLWRDVGAKRAITERLDRPLRVAFIGSLLAHKGAHLLVQAVQALPVGSVQLTLHGNADLGYAQALCSMDRVCAMQFGGRYSVAEIATRLAAADVVVVPSIWEDCAPFVVAEALAARAVVVGSHLGGIRDFLEDGKTGFLYDADDPSALARTLARFLEDPHLLGRMQREIAPPSGFRAFVGELLRAYQSASCAAAARHGAPHEAHSNAEITASNTL